MQTSDQIRDNSNHIKIVKSTIVTKEAELNRLTRNLSRDSISIFKHQAIQQLEETLKNRLKEHEIIAKNELQNEVNKRLKQIAVKEIKINIGIYKGTIILLYNS